MRLVTCGFGNQDVLSGSFPNLSGLPSSFPLPLDFLVMSSLDFCLIWLSFQLVSKPMVVVSGKLSGKQLVPMHTYAHLGWHHCSVLSQMFGKPRCPVVGHVFFVIDVNILCKTMMTADCSLHVIIMLSSTASVDISIFAKELPGNCHLSPPTFLTSKRASPAFPRSRLGLDLGKLRHQLAIGLISLIFVAYHMWLGCIESKFRLCFDYPQRLLGLWNFKRRGGFSDAAMHVNIFN